MSKHEMLQIYSTKQMAFDKQRWRVFADWLKDERDKARLSQEGLSDEVGVDRQTIYRLENALSGTRRETVIKIAEALKANVDEALTKAGFQSQTSITTNGYFKGLEKLSPEKQKIAKRQIRGIIDALAEEELTDEDFDYIDD